MRRILASLLVLAAGCSGPPHQAHEKASDRVATVDATAMVVLDDEVKWSLELLDHRAQRLADGRLRAQVRLVNKTGTDIHVQFAWTFKDDANFAVESETPFKHTLIAGGQTIDLACESLSSLATRFHLQVKTAKPGKS